MCARRFLFLVFILILLAVAGAFAIFQFGGSVLIRQATPQGRFVAPPAGSGPDYAQATSWLSRPGLADDPTRWRPEGVADVAVRGPVATFYIHPTTYLRRDRWNGPLSGNPDADFRTRLFLQSQGSAFANAGEVWAPRYRQAAFGAFLLDSKDARQALDLAYRDVIAAFDRFIAEVPDGPIILAGHSQGALHLTRLLRDRVAGKPLRYRIVAAYAVGWPISAAADLPSLGLPACARADQVGCLLSWMSFAEPANPDLVLATYEGSAGLAGGERRRADLLCVDPLGGVRNGASAPASNPGTLVPTADLRSASLVPGRVGARCMDGLLILNGEVPPLGPYVLPGNNYHVYDYALFWGAVRADVLRRTNAAWRRR